MAIHAALYHKTHYRYAHPVRVSPQVIRLRPAPHSRTHILSYSLKVTPEEHFINWQQDPQGNFLARVVFPEKVSEFKVEVDLVAEMAVLNPFDFFLEEYAEHFPFDYRDALAEELKPFMGDPVDVGPAFDKYFAGIDTTPKHIVTFLVELNQQLQEHIGYVIRMEPGVQTPEETLSSQKGSCRDSAWLLINILRKLGFAARFASGYLIQLVPDQKSLDGPSGPEEDFTDLHAWAEVFLPGAGWIGLDPTSGLLAGEGHIPLACAPKPQSASPITGALDPVETEFDFHMEVNRVFESPRVTKPYTDEAWEKLNALGQQVDERMREQDIRLTMGGEPTFISIDDMDGEEWNAGAVGPAKRKLSEVLLKRLYQRFSKGGMLHYGQGKWYPGESLPRWAYTCFWRKDGKPLWQDARWMGEMEKDYGFGLKEAEQFLKAFSDALEVGNEYIMPAFEDPWYFLWKEHKLPSNVDPLENKLEDPEERARISRVFERGLNHAKGYVLPLQRVQPWQARGAGGWLSGSWQLRSKKLFLIPGDSPVGLRLPLDSLPWVSKSDYPFVIPGDPSSLGMELPDYESLFKQFFVKAPRSEEAPEPQEGQGVRRQKLSDNNPEELSPDASGPVVRTAICIEPRDGKLFIFLPPVSRAEDYFELITAIEATAARLKMPVILEGEKPPFHPGIDSFSVTPDPGVIEVNIHPSYSWDEIVEKTEIVYEEARQTRLGTDKFMLDGRHTGTGGGNHFVLGGHTPQDSPFLRRPDLLRSMVGYWHHHPALSYLFSGLFIGPTSQSPRADEARDDILYELEIAFSEVSRLGHEPQPWLVDRIFRNLLTDATGNTHRAEFCIDKLYSPDSTSGRRGLLELRSFEMPPHSRMSLAQQLLLRGLVSWLWDHPYSPEALNRWGTQLHDRFMLPHFIWRNFMDVLDDLREGGYAFDEEWFKAHFEFRFPHLGTVTYKNISLDVSCALEPWHVMGEEGMSSGTVRFVDSSVERLQVKVQSWNSARYRLVCNGRMVPLTNTGKAGEYVAGIRYRAWQPSSCLHPTLPPDAPLYIDIVDTIHQVTVAGCVYHVGHPGGRNYEHFPINALEAECRRLARFVPFSHSAGKWASIPKEEPHDEFPLTLDLRRLPNQ